MYRVYVKREKKDNVLTGRARYRVVDCFFSPMKGKRGVRLISDERRVVVLKLENPRRVGTMIDLRKALNV